MQFFPVGLGGIGRQRHTRRLSPGKGKQQISAVVRGCYHLHHGFPIGKAQLRRHVVSQDAGLTLTELADLGFVHLLLIGKEEQLCTIGAFQMATDLVLFLELLLAVHPQRSRQNLFEIAAAGQKQMHRIIRDVILHRLFLHVRSVVEQSLSGLAVLLRGFLQFGNDNALDLLRIL